MEIKIEHINLFKTKDFELASILYASKQVLDSSYWEDGTCFFIFENNKACETVIADYYKDNLVMSAKSLMEAIKTIKSILFAR